MSEIQLATVLLGAKGFKEGNVNDTFRGQVLTANGQTRQAIIKDLNLVQLCNELVAQCLARETGLPIPDCYLGLVRTGILDVKKALQPRMALVSFLSASMSKYLMSLTNFRVRTSPEDRLY